MQNFLCVDQDFYRAISSLAGKQITTFADLHSHVAGYSSGLFDGASEAVVNKVQGHVAEQIVANHLRQLGHHVDLASHSNQAGYDLVVDHNLLINVKNHMASSGIASHFSHYPDISVVIPEHFATGSHGLLHIDAAHGLDSLHGALHGSHTVLVDHGLNHHAVVNHTRHALNAVSGHVPLHLPWITIGLSSWREARLLLDGSTGLERAVTNILCDTAGTGIGGAVGAKAGGVIGTLLLPGLGTVVGAVVGGITWAPHHKRDQICPSQSRSKRMRIGTE